MCLEHTFLEFVQGEDTDGCSAKLVSISSLSQRLRPMQVLSHESISTVLRMSRDLERNQEATCYIGNLDERVTDEIVWELMLQAGPIAHVYLPKDRISQMHQGYAFAEYQTKGDAEYSCRILNGIKLYGKPIRVNLSSNEKQEVDIGANLFVGNLDSGVDERLLYDTFATFGGVVGAPRIARDPTTNVSKNYGFVSFDSFEAADAAIESLNNQFLLNRPITVMYALRKDGKNGERHGSEAERLVAAQARKHHVLPTAQDAYGMPSASWHTTSGNVLPGAG